MKKVGGAESTWEWVGQGLNPRCLAGPNRQSGSSTIRFGHSQSSSPETWKSASRCGQMMTSRSTSKSTVDMQTRRSFIARVGQPTHLGPRQAESTLNGSERRRKLVSYNRKVYTPPL